MEHTMNTTNLESVGDRVRRIRQERGLSQRDIECDGVTFAYVSRIESGDRTPSLTALIKIAEKLNVSAIYLLTGSDTGTCPLCGHDHSK